MKNSDATGNRVSLSKRTKKMWQVSGSHLSLKVWARTSDDPDVRGWLKMKSSPPIKKTKVKIVKKSKSEKEAEKKGKK